MQSSKRPRILVVDDCTLHLRLLQTALEAEGYEVETATNGSLALAKIEASPPQLVLLDIMMPKMNGVEVLRCIRQNGKLPYIPILFITGYEEINVQEGSDIRADDLIRKPVKIDKFLTKIREFLN